MLFIVEERWNVCIFSKSVDQCGHHGQIFLEECLFVNGKLCFHCIIGSTNRNEGSFLPNSATLCML